LVKISNLKLGSSIVIAKEDVGYDTFLAVVKEYQDNLKEAADMQLKFDNAKKTTVKKDTSFDWEQGKNFEGLDGLLTKQSHFSDLAAKKLDEAYKMYKKNKTLKKIIQFRSKKDLEEKIKDANFHELLHEQENVTGAIMNLKSMKLGETIITSEKTAYCSKCGNKVKLETDKNLKKDYKYYCPNCDENLYSFEVTEK
jgi:hypothetical protein